jgi:hypothetical protein
MKIGAILGLFLFAGSTVPGLAEEFPVGCKLPAAELDTIAGNDTAHATMRGKITPAADRAWHQADPEHYTPVANTVATVSANCDAGTIELQTGGHGKPQVWRAKLPLQGAGCEDNSAILEEDFARLCPTKAKKFRRE